MHSKRRILARSAHPIAPAVRERLAARPLVPGLKTSGVNAQDIVVRLPGGASLGTVEAYLAQRGFVGERRLHGLKQLVVMQRRGRLGFRPAILGIGEKL